MSISHYDPFRDLKALQDEMNRLFTTNMSRSFGDESIVRGAWAPNVDIYENKEQIVIEAELPGMNREDFDLTIENSVLTLRGERHFEKKDEKDTYHRVERSYGSFMRSFTLPQTLSAEGATAEYNNGVLRVVLQKREGVKPRRIQVTGDDTERSGVDSKAAQTRDAVNKSAAGK